MLGRCNGCGLPMLSCAKHDEHQFRRALASRGPMPRCVCPPSADQRRAFPLKHPPSLPNRSLVPQSERPVVRVEEGAQRRRNPVGYRARVVPAYSSCRRQAAPKVFRRLCLWAAGFPVRLPPCSNTGGILPLPSTPCRLPPPLPVLPLTTRWWGHTGNLSA